MEKIFISPDLKGDYSELIVQVANPVTLTMHTYITVPPQFDAIILIDNSTEARIRPCETTNLYHHIKKVVGLKHCLGKSIQVFFVLTKSNPEIAWGFGNIHVNNGRLKDAYQIGARGTCSYQITSTKNLVYSFNLSKNITSEMLREKILEVIKSVGVNVVSTYFAETNISIFEINSKNLEIRNKMLEALEKEKSILNAGIKITALTLEPIHVRESDESRIEDRINNEEEIIDNGGENNGL